MRMKTVNRVTGRLFLVQQFRGNRVNLISFSPLPGKMIKLQANKALVELKRLSCLHGAEFAIDGKVNNIDGITVSQLLPGCIYTVSRKLQGC